MLKEDGNLKIGVLSLQGGVIEHINHIERLGHEAIEIKKEEDLDNIDFLILPGGESTTIGNILRTTGLLEKMREKIKNGLPTWGTCCGMILLAKEVEGENKSHFGLMDIKVKRNGYGSQLDSFNTNKVIDEIGKEPVELVFIRAPYVLEQGKEVKTLLEVDGKIVGVRQNNMIATSFHPELTEDTRFLEYVLKSF